MLANGVPKMGKTQDQVTKRDDDGRESEIYRQFISRTFDLRGGTQPERTASSLPMPPAEVAAAARHSEYQITVQPPCKLILRFHFAAMSDKPSVLPFVLRTSITGFQRFSNLDGRRHSFAS